MLEHAIINTLKGGSAIIGHDIGNIYGLRECWTRTDHVEMPEIMEAKMFDMNVGEFGKIYLLISVAKTEILPFITTLFL